MIKITFETGVVLKVKKFLTEVSHSKLTAVWMKVGLFVK